MEDAIYDYLIVGSGLFGSVFAQQAKAHGKRVLVLEKRKHIGGNVYTSKMHDINVHMYGAHIFHTNSKAAWDYVTQFAKFNSFVNMPIANYKNKIYSLPFNMNTFYQMWGTVSPCEAKARIQQERVEGGIETPHTLEEQAISLVGRTIYERLVKGYTEKQWGRPCRELPASIIKRLPVRFTFDNNYFDATYQGIPVNGYTELINNILNGIEVRLNTDFLLDREEWMKIAKKIVYTGPIDEYFGYRLGELAYRRIRLEHEYMEVDNYQGNAVINYTADDVPYTRILEHKWFNFGKDEHGCFLPGTVISKEYSCDWKRGDEAYYPINDDTNNALYQQYKLLGDKEGKVIFGGRLGEYRYYDMDAVIESALRLAAKEIVKGED